MPKPRNLKTLVPRGKSARIRKQLPVQVAAPEQPTKPEGFLLKTREAFSGYCTECRGRVDAEAFHGAKGKTTYFGSECLHDIEPSSIRTAISQIDQPEELAREDTTIIQVQLPAAAVETLRTNPQVQEKLRELLAPINVIQMSFFPKEA